MKTCLKCQQKHEKRGKFCSYKCSNSRSWSEAHKKELSKKMKGMRYGGAIKGRPHRRHSPWKKITCHCGKVFEVTPSSDKTCCSPECSPGSGGYREGSGRSKHGRYKGIYCASTYELAWVIYHLDHHIPFARFPGFIETPIGRYYPDFLCDGKIIEIKGYKTPAVEIKSNAAIEAGYEIDVLYRADLKFDPDAWETFMGRWWITARWDGIVPEAIKRTLF